MMQNISQNQYVLTDVKFKKAAKNVHKQLGRKLPDGITLSLGSVAQAMSLALFYMPYEEAKKTLLTNGQPLLQITNELEDNVLQATLDEVDMLSLDDCILSTLSEGSTFSEYQLTHIREAILLALPLAEYLPLELFPELTAINGFITLIQRTHPCALANALKLHEQALEKDDPNNTSMWKGRAAKGISAHAKAFSYYINGTSQTVSLKAFRNSLVLDNFVELALNSSIPKIHRSGMFTVLHSINYKYPTEIEPHPKQNQISIEQMQYITMAQTARVEKLIDHLEKLYKA